MKQLWWVDANLEETCPCRAYLILKECVTPRWGTYANMTRCTSHTCTYCSMFICSLAWQEDCYLHQHGHYYIVLNPLHKVLYFLCLLHLQLNTHIHWTESVVPTVYLFNTILLMIMSQMLCQFRHQWEAYFKFLIKLLYIHVCTMSVELVIIVYISKNTHTKSLHQQ